MERKAEHDIACKLKVLNFAKEYGNISKTCRYLGYVAKLSTHGGVLIPENS